MRSLSIPSKQKPRSLTKFRCWSLATIKISFLNSKSPCPEFLDSLFTAISCPSESLPYRCIRIFNMQPLVINGSESDLFWQTNEIFDCMILSNYLVDSTKSSSPNLICISKVICSDSNCWKIELLGFSIANIIRCVTCVTS